jgi:hypothetical protein
VIRHDKRIARQSEVTCDTCYTGRRMAGRSHDCAFRLSEQRHVAILEPAVELFRATAAYAAFRAIPAPAECLEGLSGKPAVE